MDQTYERSKDTCNLVIIFALSFPAALLLTNEHSVLEILWTFSEFLEVFAMVPQYIFCYRDRNTSLGVALYMFCFGSYRVIYALIWIYRASIWGPHFCFLDFLIGFIFEISCFLDFLSHRLPRRSILRTAVLKLDEKVNEIQETVLKVLGTPRRTNLNLKASVDKSDLRKHQ